MIILPPEAGNMGNLASADGKIIYLRYPNSGSDGDDSELMYFDLKERNPKPL